MLGVLVWVKKKKMNSLEVEKWKNSKNVEYEEVGPQSTSLLLAKHL